MKFLFSLNLLFAVAHAAEVTQLHGSGTSNPSKCYWSIMETLKEQAAIPLHMTYRSVGSGQGMKEFAAQFTATDPNAAGMAVFGSGDIPVASDLYNEITASGGGMYHLPVLTGAVSFFHSVPDITEETGALNLTACIISQIYTLDITSWGDDQITNLNPGLSRRARNTDIYVARRGKGSSSTASMTYYLHNFCDNTNQRLPEDLVNKLPVWETSGNTKDNCLKSNGMVDCIAETPGTIGYIDAGHGQSAGLSEVALPVGNSYQVSSRDLINRAVNVDGLRDADADFDGVTFVTDGKSGGWPIVLMTYVYVRKNVAEYVTDPTEQALLIAFLKALFDPAYISECVEKYGFLLPPVDSFVQPVIAELEAGVAQEFLFEDGPAVVPTSTLSFSTHRQQIADIERAALIGDVASNQKFAMAELANLKAEMAKLKASYTAVEEKNEELESALRKSGIEVGGKTGNSGRLTTVVAFASFFLWVITGAFLAFRCSKGNQARAITNPSDFGDLEMKHNDNTEGTTF